MLKTSGNTGVVVFCCGPGPVVANIFELSSPEGEICSLRFAVRYVQHARIAFRVSAISCQVICGTSFWNLGKEGLRQWASPHQSGSQPACIYLVLVAAAYVMVVWQQFVRHCALVSFRHGRSPPQEVCRSRDVAASHPFQCCCEQQKC